MLMISPPNIIPILTIETILVQISQWRNGAAESPKHLGACEVR